MAASVAEIERELAGLRDAGPTDVAWLRTSVLTHIVWAPPQWRGAAEATLAGLAERHPSRTVLLYPEPDDGADVFDAAVDLRCFSLPGLEHHVCSEVIELRLGGRRRHAAASVLAPLLIVDLPAFLRWRGEPLFGEQPFEALVELVDRLVVDSTEWSDPASGAQRLAAYFERVAASDLAWARTLHWRARLAGLWPGIADIEELAVRGPRAEALLLAGWLRSRLGRDVALAHEEAAALERVAVDGGEVEPPTLPRPRPSDLLSAELDRFSRDRVYEQAAAAVAQRKGGKTVDEQRRED